MVQHHAINIIFKMTQYSSVDVNRTKLSCLYLIFKKRVSTVYNLRPFYYNQVALHKVQTYTDDNKPSLQMAYV